MGRALAEAIAAAGETPSPAGSTSEGDVAPLLRKSQRRAGRLLGRPHALEGNLDAASEAGVASRSWSGTTGLEERHHFLVDHAAERIAVLQTGNTSLGVTLLAHLVREAAQRLGEDWDIEIAGDAPPHARSTPPLATALLLGEAAAAGRGIALAQA